MTVDRPLSSPLEQALSGMAELSKWVDHQRECAVFSSGPDGDFCNCGVNAMLQRNRALYASLKEAIPVAK